MDRFWDWTLDHPWQFQAVLTVVLLGTGAVLSLIATPLALGWLVGGVLGSLRILFQSLRFQREDREFWERFR